MDPARRPQQVHLATGQARLPAPPRRSVSLRLGSQDGALLPPRGSCHLEATPRVGCPRCSLWVPEDWAGWGAPEGQLAAQPAVAQPALVTPSEAGRSLRVECWANLPACPGRVLGVAGRASSPQVPGCAGLQGTRTPVLGSFCGAPGLAEASKPRVG